MRYFEEKKVGVAGLQPTLISLDYIKLSTQNLHQISILSFL